MPSNTSHGGAAIKVGHSLLYSDDVDSVGPSMMSYAPRGLMPIV